MYDNRGTILWTYQNPDPDATISDIAISGNGNFIGAGVYHFFNDTSEIVYFNNTGQMGWEFPVRPFGYVALSGDGQMIAASGSNFYILNAAGMVLNTWKFNESIFRVAISDDGQYAAAGTGLNAWVYVMDTNGTMLWARKTDGTYDNHGGIRALQVSRHGDRIIAQDIGGVYFFTREGTFSKSEKENNHFERHGSRSSENGEYTVSFNNEKILYYDSTGKKIWEYQISTFSDIRSFTVSDVGISGDGKYVAAIGSYDSLYVLDNRGNLLWKYRLSSSGHRIALSRNGKYIAVATQDSMYFFNIDGTPTMPEPVITQTTAIKGSAPVTTGTPKASLPVFIIMLALGVGGIIYGRNGKDR